LKRFILDYSLKNGLGNPAISLYLSGCDKKIKCKGCHNQELQLGTNAKIDFELLKENMDKNIKNYLYFHKKLHVSILGGEPLAPYNREIASQISKYIKQKYKDCSIILYSYRTIDDIKKENLLSYLTYIDYGVLGSFEEDLFIENTLPSSTNQYIYDFKNKTKLQSISLKGGIKHAI